MFYLEVDALIEGAGHRYIQNSCYPFYTTAIGHENGSNCETSSMDGSMIFKPLTASKSLVPQEIPEVPPLSRRWDIPISSILTLGFPALFPFIWALKLPESYLAWILEYRYEVYSSLHTVLLQDCFNKISFQELFQHKLQETHRHGIDQNEAVYLRNSVDQKQFAVEGALRSFIVWSVFERWPSELIIFLNVLGMVVLSARIAYWGNRIIKNG